MWTGRQAGSQSSELDGQVESISEGGQVGWQVDRDAWHDRLQSKHVREVSSQEHREISTSKLASPFFNT